MYSFTVIYKWLPIPAADASNVIKLIFWEGLKLSGTVNSRFTKDYIENGILDIVDSLLCLNAESLRISTRTQSKHKRDALGLSHKRGKEFIFYFILNLKLSRLQFIFNLQDLSILKTYCSSVVYKAEVILKCEWKARLRWIFKFYLSAIIQDAYFLTRSLNLIFSI